MQEQSKKSKETEPKLVEENQKLHEEISKLTQMYANTLIYK